ncbi:MAG: hypothetical protein IH984_14735 [Planctomycetes bacterium]|nr:hypothetical protein [Planctomycetota bacterium]
MMCLIGKAVQSSRIRFLILIGLILVLTIPVHGAAIRFVDDDARPGDGTSRETVFDDLQDAIDLASYAKNGIT